MNYQDALNTQAWEEKRRGIIERDGHMCQGCATSDSLQVHHKEYFPGEEPWETDSYYLITYCPDCHRAEHSDEWLDEEMEELWRSPTELFGTIEQFMERLNEEKAVA